MRRDPGEQQTDATHPVSKGGPIFILPINEGLSSTPNASWITTAGLASAARERWGESRVVTPNGILSPEELIERASRAATHPDALRIGWKWVPRLVRTAAKDVRLLMAARRFHKAVTRCASIGDDFEFVWQRHVPFHTAGLAIANSLSCPLVLSVHAMAVDEADQWGVSRPGWGRLIERFGEIRLLRQADLVACVSEEVADLVRSHGLSDSRIIVTPNGVDLQRFQPTEPDYALRGKLGLHPDEFVLGWVGSFRAFHGLDRLFDAMEDLQRRDQPVTLLLIGSGPGLQAAKRDAGSRNLRNVRFAGSYTYDQMPRVLSVVQAAVAMGSPDRPFHYSPVKVREYMAMGLPVIAARLGELERMLTDGDDAILIDASKTEQLVEAIERLMSDPDTGKRLGDQARKRVIDNGSWDAVLSRLVERLDQIGCLNHV